MTSPDRYWLSLRPGAVMGPHLVDRLRYWVQLGFLSPEALACKEGSETWTSIAEIPKFGDVPRRVREDVAREKERLAEPWYDDPVTEKQLGKLDYFEIPYERGTLRKGCASRLIDFFCQVDPERERQYQERPASTEQARELQELCSEVDPATLRYGTAKKLIEELRTEANHQEWDNQRAIIARLSGHSCDVDLLNEMVNDAAMRDLYEYEKLSKKQLKAMLNYLEEQHPEWREEPKTEIASLVRQTFPASDRSDVMGLSQIINDSFSRQQYRYNKFTDREVRHLLAVLERDRPDWRKYEHKTLAGIALKLFPHRWKVLPR